MNEKYKNEYRKIRHDDCLELESFDQRYNLNTSHAIIELSVGLLGPGIEENKNEFETSNGFQNFPTLCVDMINEKLQEIADMSEYNFVDIGSGKGKVLFNCLIKNAKYKSYLGIEIDPKYHNIALENLQNINIEIEKEINFLNMDALEYVCVAEPTIYFINRPFSTACYQIFLEKNMDLFLNNKTIIVSANPTDERDVSAEKRLGLQVIDTNVDEFYFANMFKTTNV
jgi:16S rRNA G966 N2-methylase RsmD